MIFEYLNIAEIKLSNIMQKIQKVKNKESLVRLL